MKLPKFAMAVPVACLLAADSTAQSIPPGLVIGKEYSNNVDETAGGAVDFLQNINWDPPIPVDTFDYSGSGPPPEDPDQVDALANHQDALFTQVANGLLPFVVSFSPSVPNFSDNLYFHNTAGNTGLWAAGPIDINVPVPPDDVDAVELWGFGGDQHDTGGAGPDDANNYSYIGDCILPGPPAPPGTPKISVFFYDPVTHVSSIYITHDELRDALVLAYASDPDLPDIEPERQIDVDALMVQDQQGNRIWEDGDRIIFSLHPTADTIQVCGGVLPPNPFDGGEIWVWTRGTLPRFLVHGGRTWDTPNAVATIFSVATENINAFEAVTKDTLGGAFCNVSDGALAFCPCSNPGNPNSGCDIAQGLGGVLASPTAQDTSLLTGTITGTGYPPLAFPTAILIRANNLEPAPVVFGDGLRCVGTVGFVRLAATTAAGGTSVHSFGHGAGPGGFFYQIWFRNTPVSFCVTTGPSSGAFNLSNGTALYW